MSAGFVVGEEHRGTPASTWAQWRPDWPVLVSETWERVVVVAAHPDDDVLGVGGLLGRLARHGVEMVGVQLTDGTAAYPDSPTLTPAELGEVRSRENRAAYAALGLPDPVRCGLPDGGLAEREDELVDVLTPLIRPGDRWLVPWREDRHPDHEAAGRAAARVCAQAAVELWEYPIWMWHWAAPRSPEVPWARAARVDLTGTERLAKRRAAQCFHSQIAPLSPHPADAPVVPPFALERLTSDREVLFGG